ncbi:MAG: hypothetical protein HQK49_00390 [Oligoflexia bacterium]|nr:hypothetical protein [Oligoflexia bacterium]
MTIYCLFNSSLFTLTFLSLILANFLLFFIFPYNTFASNDKTKILLISGGGQKSENNYRYENNLALFRDVLEVKGYSTKNMTTLFNEGKNSLVKDIYYSTPSRKKSKYGISYEKEGSKYHQTLISSIIDGPADNQTINKEFEKIIDDAKNKRIDNFILYTTDHGTSHEDDYEKSFISLSKEEKLGVDEIDKFAKELAKYNVPVTVIGVQCFSGANMNLALDNDNVCAFSAAESYEVSNAFPDTESDVKKYAMARYSFSEYSFLFSCALHQPKKNVNTINNSNNNSSKSKNMERELDFELIKLTIPSSSSLNNKFTPGQIADSGCIYKGSADVDGDGKVSFAEAHYYALANMESGSAPQISSQKYARKIFNEKNKNSNSPTLEDISKIDIHNINKCLPKKRNNKLKHLSGNAKAVLLKENAKKMLELKKKYFATLLEDSDIIKLTKIKPDDSIDRKLARIEEVYKDYQKNYDQMLKLIKVSMGKLNDVRKKIEAVRTKTIEHLKSYDQRFAEDYKAFSALENKIQSKIIPEETDDMKKDKTNTSSPTSNIDPNELLKIKLTRDRLKEHLDDTIDDEMNRKYNTEVLKLESVEKFHKDFIDKLASRGPGKEEDKIHDKHGKLRKAYELAEGFMAEMDLLKNGTDEQILKLNQLYNCENKAI